MTYSDWIKPPDIEHGEFVRAAVVSQSLHFNMDRVLHKTTLLGSDHLVTSSIVLVDTLLKMDMGANELWYVSVFVRSRCATAGGNPGLRFGFTGPTGCYISLQTAGTSSAGANQIAFVRGTTTTQETLWSISGTSLNTTGQVVRGVVYVDAAPGTFMFRFAQVTSSATATIASSASRMHAVKIGTYPGLPVSG